MQIVKLTLANTNAKKIGVYYYLPVVYKDGKFYYCHLLSSPKRLTKKTANLELIEISREVKREYWAANGICKFIEDNNIFISQ